MLGSEALLRAIAEAERRIAVSTGGPMSIHVDMDSFDALPTAEARDGAMAVVADVALQRLTGAVDWFCEWPSCKAFLAANLSSASFAYAAVDGLPTVTAGGCIEFASTFASELSVSQPNQVAHVLDEHFGLYRGRVYDIRQRIIPTYEAGLRGKFSGAIRRGAKADAFPARARPSAPQLRWARRLICGSTLKTLGCSTGRTTRSTTRIRSSFRRTATSFSGASRRPLATCARTRTTAPSCRRPFKLSKSSSCSKTIGA